LRQPCQDFIKVRPPQLKAFPCAFLIPAEMHKMSGFPPQLTQWPCFRLILVQDRIRWTLLAVGGLATLVTIRSGQIAMKLWPASQAEQELALPDDRSRGG
jgi:hypothetical protein